MQKSIYRVDIDYVVSFIFSPVHLKKFALKHVTQRKFKKNVEEGIYRVF